MMIISIGYNHIHDADFIIDRPNGAGNYVFLLVKTTSHFVVRGQEYAVAKGSYALFSPETPCSFKALADKYIDDWFHFDLDSNEVEKLKEMGIIFDKPMYLGDVDELSRIILNMTYENYSTDVFHDEIKFKYADILFMKIARILQSQVTTTDSSFSDKKSILITLRTKIYDEPDKISDVSDMARFAGMSRSGLQHNYKKVFGVSIMQDVITSRIERAKRRLTGTNMSIADISRACGYKCEYSFMRQFKERVGQTPTEYRKNKAIGMSDLVKDSEV